MREIKFRGFCKHKNGKTIITINGDKKSGTWVYGVPNLYMEIQMPKLVIPKTVGQYIGLKDKNGKEIYEGDVLHCWGGECCQGYWEHDIKKVITNIIVDCFMMGEQEDLEVIGNIYENPELMEGKNEQ